MGIYFNPNHESFTCDKNSKIYVDKTGLLEYLNGVLGTNSKCIAVSHARRFGKSHALTNKRSFTIMCVNDRLYYGEIQYG